MKFPTLFLSLALLSAVFVGCNERKENAPASKTGSAEASEEPKSAKAKDTIENLFDTPEPGEEAELRKIAEISTYSSVLNDSWNNLKTLNFEQKDSFLKQLKSIGAETRRNIGALKQAAPTVTGDAERSLIEMINSLSKGADGLTQLYKKGTDITSDNWSAFQNQVGLAIKGLSNDFSGLSSVGR